MTRSAPLIAPGMEVMESTPRSPLSDTAQVRLLKRTAAAEIVRDWQKLFGVDIAGELASVNCVALYECLESGLRFFTPAAAAGSARMYEQLERFEWYYREDKWEHRIALRDLRRCRRVLEVGCGRGTFVRRLKQLGIGAQGLELNPKAALAAQAAGLPVRHADLAELAREGRRYDAICSFQVLEHVADPRGFLTTMVGLLEAGGRLILSVPNSETFTRHAKLDLLNEPPHHMAQWSERSFAFLTRILPVELLHFRREPLAPYHVDWYLSVQAQRLPLAEKAAERLLRSALGRLLRIGALRWPIRGHTLYVCFEKPR